VGTVQKQVSADDSEQDSNITPLYASRSLNEPIPKYSVPEHGIESAVAYQLVHDELMLDGIAHMNMATFVTTWMEPEATRLMTETLEKNIIDKDEYPQTAEIEKRCVNMLAELWNAPKGTATALGTSTVGSSEACMLAGMALKWKWRERQRAAGKSIEKPNLVMGINVQVCWEKFCRYWDVEPRYVPLESGRYHIGAREATALCDENTIGTVAILGSTFDGSYEPVQELSQALDELQTRTGLDIPIHVDAASGGFVAPFIQPEIVWDFRLLRVKSINSSSHKYGMVYPGLGWVIWRHAHDLPEDLIFKVNYLGGEMPSFAINFSRPGNSVIAQYFNFLRLGHEGYRRIQQRCQDTALYLSGKLGGMGPFELLSKGDELPVFAFKLAPDIKHFTLFDLSDRLRQRGWQVPAYTLPKNLEDITVMRMVVKENFSRDMADMLLDDITEHLQWFEKHQIDHPTRFTPMFHH
jgi:glutamate decarboxylase